ncbi:hypothetical protein AXG93_1433s1040 [Marchantia polymorpha subsp. ruderalis]|uniref:Uncharacterized protein n=1 Tax=Marchantia polymorpha subsp. ruderalis TaxID=1480154 RepID=A0A176WBK2_MARPO|nr:hypothetical protein AXG93_1433s1040 [Marchantia polymorpha subsp. ruderalis]
MDIGIQEDAYWRMAPLKTKDKVQKLVPLKVLYKELRPFMRELSKLHLDFLLWNWNCISASICKEIIDKNQTKGMDLRGNPMLWTMEHWAKVMGPCAGSDGDLQFEKSSVKLTRMEEFSFGPLFNNGRSGTNGWKTVDYKDPKRRAIALGIIHILRPARTTYITAWQVGFFERVIKGHQVHWARIFYDLVWVNASSRVERTATPTKASAEVATNELTQPLVTGGPSTVPVEILADMTGEPLKERTKIVSPNSLSSEPTRFVRSEDVPQPKIGGELATEFTLSEAILEQIVAEVSGTVGNLSKEPEPPSLEEERLITTAEKREEMHVEALAKAEARRAEEVCIAEELRGKIVEAKTAEEKLRSEVAEIASMGVQTIAKRRNFPLRELAQEVEEVVEDEGHEVDTEDDSSTESRGVGSRGRLTREEGLGATIVREKEAPAGKKPRTTQVLAVSSNTEEDLVVLEQVAAKAVEDVEAAESGSQKVASPRTFTGTVILKTGKDPSAEEVQSQVLSAADMLCVQVFLLLQ